MLYCTVPGLPALYLRLCICSGGRGGRIGLITIVLDKRFRLWIYMDAHRGTSFAEGHFSGAFRASRLRYPSGTSIYTRGTV